MQPQSTRTVNLPSGLKAVLKSRLTYGDHVTVDKVLYSRAKISVDKDTGEANTDIPADFQFDFIKTKLLVTVKFFQNPDGTEQVISEEAINALDYEDAQELIAEVEKVFDAAKKKTSTKTSA